MLLCEICQYKLRLLHYRLFYDNFTIVSRDCLLNENQMNTNEIVNKIVEHILAAPYGEDIITYHYCPV